MEDMRDIVEDEPVTCIWDDCSNRAVKYVGIRTRGGKKVWVGVCPGHGETAASLEGMELSLDFSVFALSR